MARKTQMEGESITIWSWNCRSIKSKLASLSLYVKVALVPPDIICLQEAGEQPKPITGYKVHYDPNHSRVATLVRKDLATTLRVLPGEEISHLIITIWPVKKGRPKQVICNVYSPPRDKKADFASLFRHLQGMLEHRDRLFITGDFNAKHNTWGYPKADTKGTKLLETIERHGYTLITLPGTPTRIGNSASRDTTPDLTITNNTVGTSWRVLNDSLGSDHYIIEITSASAKLRRPLGKAKITNWPKFRERQQSDLDINPTLPEYQGRDATIKEWASN